ncbi:right-handed parallel beta-helix repeat-containing protein [Flavobacterium sp.]|uniref:T9SS type A sorting domain-containing protein n=1 Tax=Flavobacterium sp. TaxID=239 RepID=UPI00260D0905|nr:right-handed parallel beta-helix repeat-containing protein [Flavobacterium sp.]
MKRIFLFLFAVVLTPTFAINYYVSPTGNDNNNGLSSSTPFQTLDYAASLTIPGDTVFLMNGIHTSSLPNNNILNIYNSGTEASRITYTNFPGETPILKMFGNNWGGIALQGADYITVEGITIIGNNDNISLEYAQSQQLNTSNPSTSGNGIGIVPEYNNDANKPHHNIVRNCTVSKCGGGGIYTYNADYTTIENNTVSECGWYSPYDNSGISMYQNWNSDTFTGIKNYIVGNTCYRNENYIPFFAVGSITDGNGIIIDDGRNTQNGSTLGIYTAQTYIANNLIFDNGGRGIHCYESDNVIIVNNTCYKNCQSPFTREGELTAFDASNITYLNNIAAPDTDIPPIFAYAATTSNTTSQYNLFTANETLASPIGTTNSVGNAGFMLASSNPVIADFHLQATSDALNSGTLSNAPLLDKDGIVRLSNGTIDMGCYEFQNTFNVTNFSMNGVTVYPNPVTSFLHIDFTIKNEKIKVVNLQGQIVYTNENPGETIDFSTFQNGIYFLSFEKQNKTIKVVKQ